MVTAASPGFVNHSYKVVHTWVIKSRQLSWSWLDEQKKSNKIINCSTLIINTYPNSWNLSCILGYWPCFHIAHMYPTFKRHNRDMLCLRTVIYRNSYNRSDVGLKNRNQLSTTHGAPKKHKKTTLKTIKEARLRLWGRWLKKFTQI